MTHHLPDGGVCRHPMTETDPVLWHRTLALVAVDPARRTLDVRADGPCGRRFEPAETTPEQVPDPAGSALSRPGPA
jgi:isopenicillin-N N-acyltransferase like protein